MKDQKKPEIKLKKHLRIGAISAENDGQFLSACFIETGDYDALIDTDDDKSILLGRTGAGKSALLQMIKEREENVIEIEPEELALKYIANSNVLTLLEACDVNLDPFYQLLWKHIFVVELIKKRYNVHDESSTIELYERFRSLFRKDQAKERLLKYLSEWQDKFWLPVEERVREITTKIESQLATCLQAQGELGFITSILSPTLSASARREKISKLSKEEKEEVRDRVRSSVNSVQIQELHHVIKLLADKVFCDKQQKFYVLIDKIDENWIDDRTRHKLIRALIDTIKPLRKIRTVKFLLSMRVDLLQTVFDRTRDFGFQEDKYRDYTLQIRWTEKDLIELIERRIGHLFQKQYEKKDARFSDLFPEYVGSTKTEKWFIQRTLNRPRDVIVYINLCLDRAAGKSNITASNIRDMEIDYSRERLGSVCQEWLREYPALETATSILKRKRESITHADFDKPSIDELANEILIQDIPDGGLIVRSVEAYLNKEITRASLLNRIISVFYITGIVGIKRDGHESAIWSCEDSPTVSESEIKRSSHFYIHPMFWRALGTNVDKRKT